MTESDFLLTQRVAANLAASAEAHQRHVDHVAGALAVLVVIASVVRILLY